VILNNIAKVFSYSLVSNAFGALATFAIIRVMSPDQYASYTMVLAIVSVLTSVVVSAFNRIFIVGYGRFNIGNEIGSFFTAQLALLITVGLITWPFVRGETALYGLILFLSLSICAVEFLRTDYQRLLIFSRFSQVWLGKSALYLLMIFGIVAVVGPNIKAWHAILAQSLASLAVGFPIILQRKMLIGCHHLKLALKIAVSIFSGEYRYLFGYLFFLAFFSQFGVFMLKLLSDEHNLATYGAAFRYYGFLIIGLNSVKAVYLPSIQNALSTREMNRIFHNHRYVVLISVPVFLFGCFISEWIIPWIDKGKYPDAVTVFQVLSLSAIVSLAFSPHVTVLMKAEQFLLLLVLIISGLFVYGISSYLLIGTSGALGAAWATLMAAGFVNVGFFIYSRRIRMSE
jgi:O-antigen/teichoic acid export membrane protein